MTKYLTILLFSILYLNNLFAQNVSLQKKRQNIILISNVSIYSISYTGMYFLWYKNNEKQNFHFFNDSKEWLQMDKVGHGFSTYYISKTIYNELEWANIDNKKSLNSSLLYGFVTVSTIEIWDGFYKNWGASISDVSANLIGGSMFYFQQKIWNEQKITPKFSFHQTNYSKVRSSLLGDNLAMNIFKDYNGQTYWLSFNIKSILNINNFPSWLNFDFGYSAKGMIGGSNNSFSPYLYPNNIRKRQYLFSLDLDLRKIKSKSKFANIVLKSFNTLKLPFPTIELSNNSLKYHWLYF